MSGLRTPLSISLIALVVASAWSPAATADPVCDLDSENLNLLCGGDPFNLPVPDPLNVLTGGDGCDFGSPWRWDGILWSDGCNNGDLGDLVPDEVENAIGLALGAMCAADAGHINPLCGGDPGNQGVLDPSNVLTGEGDCDFSQPQQWVLNGRWHEDCNDDDVNGWIARMQDFLENGGLPVTGFVGDTIDPEDRDGDGSESDPNGQNDYVETHVAALDPDEAGDDPTDRFDGIDPFGGVTLIVFSPTSAVQPVDPVVMATVRIGDVAGTTMTEVLVIEEQTRITCAARGNSTVIVLQGPQRFRQNGDSPTEACGTETFHVVIPSDGSGLTERTLLHEESLGIESQPLPPVGTGGVPVPDVQPQPGQPVPDVPGQPGQAVPDVPGQPGQAVPDVPSTPGQAVPDHDGTDPVVTPGVGEDVGVLSTRDDGANYCAYFTPEGGSEQLLACAGKSFLGPLDPSMPRGDTPLVFYDPDDVPGSGPIVTPDVPPTPGQATPDVPPTGPVATPDVPATGPVATPDVPPTPGQTTPDVPPVPVGSLGNSPNVTIDVDVSYSYDAGRLEPLVNVLGQQSWSPIGPTPDDVTWLASPSNAAALTVTVTVYKDGVSQGTVSHSVPALGQVLAAAERTAGTLP